MEYGGPIRQRFRIKAAFSWNSRPGMMRDLKKKVMKGGVYYALRQAIISVIQFSSSLVILRWLDPGDFGYFATVSLFLGLIQLVADGGLGVFLVQRVANIDDRSLSEIASLQMMVYLGLHVLVAGLWVGLHWADGQTTFVAILWLAMCSIPMGILRAGSITQLERNLAFDRIAKIEVAESMAYAGSLIFFAVNGLGVWSLVLALLVKSVVGLALARYFQPWKLHFHCPAWSAELKRGIVFGLNYQVPSLVTTIRLAVNPVIVGSILGLNAVGVADRGIYLAGLPLFFLSAIQQKLLFPYVARIQTDPTEVRRSFEDVFYLSSLLDKIAYIPLVVFVGPLIRLYFPQWTETIPVIHIALIGNVVFGAFAFSSNPFLLGLGHSSILSKISISAAVASWLLAWPLVKMFGIQGYALIGLVLWVAGAVPTILILRRYIPNVRVREGFLIPLACFGASCGAIWALTRDIEGLGAVGIISYSVLGIVLYLLMLFALDRRQVTHLIRRIAALLLNR